MRRALPSFVATLLVFGLTTFTPCQPVQAVDFYQTTVLNDNPLAYWRLGEASTASPAANLGTLGAGSNGTYGSTTALGAPGALFGSTNTAGGFAFGSTTSSVTNSALAFPTGSFSTELWVKSAVRNQTQGLISYNSNTSPSTSGENNYLLAIQNTNSLNFFMSNSAQQVTGLDIADGDWHHIVTTWDFSTGKFDIYNNGVSAFSQNSFLTGIGRTTLGSLVLGQEQDGYDGTYSRDPAQSFGGNLDEFALYGFVLSPEQVLLHYNVGVGNILPPPPAPEPSSFCLLGLGALVLGQARRRRRAMARV